LKQILIQGSAAELAFLVQQQEKELASVKEELQKLQDQLTVRNRSLEMTGSDETETRILSDALCSADSCILEAAKIRQQAKEQKDLLLADTEFECRRMKENVLNLIEDCWYAFRQKLESAGVSREEIAGAAACLQDELDPAFIEGPVCLFR
jgi:hypothetical protein